MEKRNKKRQDERHIKKVLYTHGMELYQKLYCETCKEYTLHILCKSETSERDVYACMECATERTW